RAYGLLYEIETTLAALIEENMINHYGIGWNQRLDLRRNFKNLHLYELVSFFGKYSSILTHFTETERMKLYEIVPIRNKICHMKLITLEELEQLKMVHSLVINAENFEVCRR